MRLNESVLDEQNEELVGYMSEMIKLISSGKEDVDQAHLKLASENIHAKALVMHKEYVCYLEICLKEVNERIRLSQ